MTQPTFGKPTPKDAGTLDAPNATAAAPAGAVAAPRDLTAAAAGGVAVPRSLSALPAGVIQPPEPPFIQLPSMLAVTSGNIAPGIQFFTKDDTEGLQLVNTSVEVTPSGAGTMRGRSVAWLDNGAVCAAGNGVNNVQFFERSDDTIVTSDIATDQPVYGVSIASADGLSFTPDGEIMVVASSTAITVYDRNENQFIRRPADAVEFTGNPRCAKLSPDGAMLIIGTDATPFMHVYDVVGGDFIERPPVSLLINRQFFRLAFSADSQHVLVQHGGTGSSAAIYSTADFTGFLAAEGGFQSGAFGVDIRPEGAGMLALSYNRAESSLLTQSWLPGSEPAAAIVASDRPPANSVGSVRFDATGERLYIGSHTPGEGGLLRVYDVLTSASINLAHTVTAANATIVGMAWSDR